MKAEKLLTFFLRFLAAWRGAGRLSSKRCWDRRYNNRIGKSRKWRKGLVFSAILGIALSIIAYVALRPTDGLAFLDQSVYRVYSRQEILGKPTIDLPWFGGQRLRFPAKPPEISLDLQEMPTAAGVLWAGREAFGPVRWSVEGVPLETVQYDEFFGPERATVAPYVFGTKSKIAEVVPYPGATPIRVQLPGNGLPAPKLPVLDQRLGPWRLILTPRPLISPRSPLVYDVRVEGQPTSLLVAAQARFEPEEEIWESNHIICRPGQGKLVIQEWPKKGTLVVRVSALKLRRQVVDTLVTATPTRTEVTLRTPDGTELIKRHYGSDGEGSSGSIRSPIAFFYGQIVLGFDHLGSVASLGGSRPFDSISRLQSQAFVKTLRNGQKLAVDLYEEAGKPTEFRMPFTFPDPKQFEADRLDFDAEETDAQRRAWRAIRLGPSRSSASARQSAVEAGVGGQKNKGPAVNRRP